MTTYLRFSPHVLLLLRWLWTGGLVLQLNWIQYTVSVDFGLLVKQSSEKLVVVERNSSCLSYMWTYKNFITNNLPSLGQSLQLTNKMMIILQKSRSFLQTLWSFCGSLALPLFIHKFFAIFP